MWLFDHYILAYSFNRHLSKGAEEAESVPVYIWKRNYIRVAFSCTVFTGCAVVPHLPHFQIYVQIL